MPANSTRICSLRDAGARRNSTRRHRRAAIAAIAGVMLVIGAGTAALAEDPDGDDDTFEQKVIKNVLGSLGVDTGRGTIDYSERSPLVIPPSRDLPPPEAKTGVNNPAWPVDPERAHKKKKIAKPLNDSVVADRIDRGWIPPSELRQGASPDAKVTKPDPRAGEESGRVLKPSELGGQPQTGLFGSFSWNALTGYHSAESAPFSGEPTRQDLTQPPVGYQTPSAQFPYGINPDNTHTTVMQALKDHAVGSLDQ